MIKILLVDDDPNILSAYSRNIRRKYDIRTAGSGYEGLRALRDEGPFAVVVSDYRMPEMDGIEFLARVKESSPDTVRVMLTGEADMQAAINAINEGNIFRFLTKPCPNERLLEALGAASDQYQLVRTEKELLDQTLKGSVKILVDIMGIMNPVAFSRLGNLRTLARRLARRLKLKNTWEIELAVLLSQIGTVTVPLEVLEKKQAGQELSPGEEEILASHPAMARRLLQNIPRLTDIAEGLAYQLKSYDGEGFPADTRKGKQIPLIGRLMRVLLAFDDLHKEGMKPKKAMESLRAQPGRFDPDILDALEAEVMKVEQGYVVRAKPLSQVFPGMLVADSIVDGNGVVLIPANYEITEVLKLRLHNYAQLGIVNEPIKILEPLVQEVH